MKFTIRTDEDAKERAVIRWADISKALKQLQKAPDAFAILMPEKPLHGSTYLQTINDAEADEADVYWTEMRIYQPLSDKEFNHYGIELHDFDELMQLYTDYYLDGKLPDTSKWRDITDTMN